MSMSTASPVRRLLGEPERTTIGASRAALLLLAVGFGALSAAGTDVSLRTQMIAYLVGMIALNLPHGGYEHFSNLRRRGLPFGARYVGLYVGFVATFVALFIIAPLLALALAFGTAVAKGGHGDLRVMDALVGTDHLPTRPQRALAALVRGGAVMIVPAVFWTDIFYGFTGIMLGVFDGQLAGPAASSPSSSRGASSSSARWPRRPSPSPSGPSRRARWPAARCFPVPSPSTPSSSASSRSRTSSSASGSTSGAASGTCPDAGDRPRSTR